MISRWDKQILDFRVEEFFDLEHQVHVRHTPNTPRYLAPTCTAVYNSVLNSIPGYVWWYDADAWCIGWC